jgi:hypothetical protein
MVQYYILDETRLARLDPNFELLASTTGFPFILPGNVGMAWYDTNTTAQSPYDFVMEQLDEVLISKCSQN